LTFFKVGQRVCFCYDIKVEIVKVFYEIELSTFDFNYELELMFCDTFASVTKNKNNTFKITITNKITICLKEPIKITRLCVCYF